MPHWLAASAIGGKLEAIMEDTISTGSPRWLVYPQNKFLSARVQAFLKWVPELFERTNPLACKLMLAPAGAAQAPAGIRSSRAAPSAMR